MFASIYEELDKEISKISLDSEESASTILCREYGFIDKNDTVATIKDSGAWTKESSETYVSRLQIEFYRNGVESDRDAKNIVAKAYSGTDISNSPSEWCDEWLRRAKRLSEYGIETADVYISKNGVLFMEDIRTKFTDTIELPVSDEARNQLLKLASMLDLLKVCPVQLVKELGVKNDLPAIVSFGKRLGGVPNKFWSDNYCFDLIRKELSQL